MIFFIEQKASGNDVSHHVQMAQQLTGRLLGFVSWLKQDTRPVTPSSSVIHRQALTSKKLNPLSPETLAKAIKVTFFFLKVDH